MNGHVLHRLYSTKCHGYMYEEQYVRCPMKEHVILHPNCAETVDTEMRKYPVNQSCVTK